MRVMPQHYWFMITSKSADVDNFTLPNCHYLKIEDFAEYNYLQGVYPQTEMGTLFNKMSGEYPIDLIMTTRSPIGAVLKRNFRGGNKSNSYIPVLTLITKVMSPGATHDVVAEDDMKLRAVTYSECPTMLFTEYERELALDTVKSMMLPSAFKQAMENCKTIPQGMDIEKHAKAIGGVRKRDRFTLYWGGRFIANKRWEDIFKIYQSLKVSEDIDIQITSPTSSMPCKDTSSCEDIDIKYGLTQDEVYKIQAECHAGMVYSQHEGLAIGYIEQIMSGLVMIFTDRKWAHELFRGLKYPFIFKSEMESRAMLKWIKKNYDKATEMMLPVREWIRENYSLQTSAQKLDLLCKEIVKDTWTDIRSDKILLEMLRLMPKTFTFSKFINDLIKQHPGYAMSLKSMYLSSDRAELGRRDMKAWLEKHCVDTNTTADITFIKK